jgi:hypothetical protein
MTETWTRGLLLELPEDECLRLLATRRVGRLVFVDEEGPVALPVNYVSQEGAILLRTSPHGSIGLHVRDRIVGFEVDDLDEASRTGWSVVLRGTASFVDTEDLPVGPGARPQPWPDGVRSLHVRISRTSVSGRRLLPA